MTDVSELCDECYSELDELHSAVSQCGYGPQCVECLGCLCDGSC